MNGSKFLRSMIIFTNVLNYLILIGLVLFILVQVDTIQDSNMLNIWVIITIIIAISAVFTTYSIVKKIKQGII